MQPTGVPTKADTISPQSKPTSPDFALFPSVSAGERRGDHPCRARNLLEAQHSTTQPLSHNTTTVHTYPFLLLVSDTFANTPIPTFTMRLISVLAAAAALASSAFAANSTANSTYIYKSSNTPTSDSALVWSINTVNSTGDVYFHLEAPYSGSWAGIGFGGQMANSLFVIIYPSWNGTGITMSPRLSTGYAEPVYTKDKVIEPIFDKSLNRSNTIDTVAGIMYANGVCRGCATWNGGSLDLKSTAQPFIFGVGPLGYMQDDSLEAPLKRHSFIGGFKMDLTAATSATNGSVPVPSNGTYIAFKSSAQSDNWARGDGNWKSTAHAGVMIFSWIVLFPLGSLLLRLFNKVILHAIVQFVGVCFVVIGFALGIGVSKYFNRSKNYTSAHQLIGFLLFAGLFVQLGLGIVGHRIFKKSGQPSKLMKIHLIFGISLVVVAIVNGGLGLSLAQNGYLWIKYLVLCIAAAIIFAIIRTIGFCIQKRRQNQPSQPIANQGVGPDGYSYPQYMIPKMPYVQSQPVPLRPYGQSSESVPHYDGPAQQPRQMV